ncbi:MAG: imidazolonepropionase [Anaerolineales bacterium]|nr:imidazolonepropionase [Anaerolineales bacterium]
MIVDRIVDRIGQLCVMPAHEGKPQRGEYLGDLGLIQNAAVAMLHGRIVAVGEREAVLAAYSPNAITDAEGRLVTPGLVDPHTHMVWAGDRAAELEQRINGATYMEINAAGGGINRTVRETRAATLESLINQTAPRLLRALQHGTTTLECKTGYGLNTATEITLLNAIALLDMEQRIDLVPTFMGAHDIPPEFAEDSDGYVDLIVNEMIPKVAVWKAELYPGILYCDVFCEQGAFSVAQTERIFEMARMAGMTPRLHADEFAALGGVPLAVAAGARSVDHLLVTPVDQVRLLAASETIATLLPATPFGLGITNTAPARALIEAGAVVALGTDCNPGTAWCENMQFVLALAARNLGMTPAQSLAAATINAAFAVDRGDQVGSIEVGKKADLVLWDAEDYRFLAYRFGGNLAHTVIKDGEIAYQS